MNTLYKLNLVFTSSSRRTGFAGLQAGGPLGGQCSTRSDKRGGYSA